MRLPKPLLPFLVFAGAVTGCPATKNPVVPPVATINVATMVKVGGQAILDGSRSTSSDGVPLTYRWTLQAPAGSAATLDSASAATPSFIADRAGEYAVQLTVTAGALTSTPASVTVTATQDNLPPRASAKADASVKLGAVVRVDGSASVDPDGDPLTYRWTLKPPHGSSATLDDGAAVGPRFTADVEGAYSLALVVNDGHADSPPVALLITAARGNIAPVADAGADRTVVTGATVALDGGKSADADGDNLTYRWTLTPPAGSNAKLDDKVATKPHFVVDAAGRYEVSLQVNDGRTDSSAATIVVTAQDKPVAVVETSFSGWVGDPVTLDGRKSKSPLAGATLTYRWTLTPPQGSSAALDAATAATPTFTPDLPGTYGLTLVVDDGSFDSEPASANVTATAHRAPVAVLEVFDKICRGGPPASSCPNAPHNGVRVGDTIWLTGRGSSAPDGDVLTYKWTVSDPTGAAVAVIPADDKSVLFTIGSAGDYAVALVVNDGFLDSAAATAKVTATVNQKPTADAGSDRTVSVGKQASVAARGSDPEGDRLTFTWTLVSQPASSSARLTQTGQVASITPDVVGAYVLSLQAKDPRDAGEPVTLVISAVSVGADAGPHRIIASGSGITIAASASDSDAPAAQLTYAWRVTSQPQGATALPVPANVLQPWFTPDVAGNYTLQLTVTDVAGDTIAVETVITAKDPVAMPVVVDIDTSFKVGKPINFGQSGSDGIEPDTLRYSWSIDFPWYGLPADETLHGARLSMTPNTFGPLRVTLTVTDSNGGHANIRTITEQITF